MNRAKKQVTDDTSMVTPDRKRKRHEVEHLDQIDTTTMTKMP